MNPSTGLFPEKGTLRRRYPRRPMRRRVGVLSGGTYFLAQSLEIGEGGMSVCSEYLLNDGAEVVVSVQLPQGAFVFLRGVVCSTQKKEGDHNVTHGLTFTEVEFSVKRKIRSFVSARTEPLP